MRTNIPNVLLYVICIAALNFFAFQFAGSADATQAIEGEITSIDLAANSFQVASGDTAAEKEMAKTIIVLPDTQFSGAASLAEFRVEDVVSIKAQLNDETQLLEAREIALTKVKIRDTAL